MTYAVSRHLCASVCTVRRAVRTPQQGEPAPPEHKSAVRLAALIIAADAAALATVTSTPGSFAPADGLLDAADVLAAAERAGDWLCTPLLWQASCALPDAKCWVERGLGAVLRQMQQVSVFSMSSCIDAVPACWRGMQVARQWNVPFCSVVRLYGQA